MNKTFCDRCGKDITNNAFSIDCDSDWTCVTLSTHNIKHCDLCYGGHKDFQELWTKFLQKGEQFNDTNL